MGVSPPATWVDDVDVECMCAVGSFDLPAERNGVSTNRVQCEAPKIAKLVYNSNNYGLWYL